MCQSGTPLHPHSCPRQEGATGWWGLAQDLGGWRFDERIWDQAVTTVPGQECGEMHTCGGDHVCASGTPLHPHSCPCQEGATRPAAVAGTVGLPPSPHTTHNSGGFGRSFDIKKMLFALNLNLILANVACH